MTTPAAPQVTASDADVEVEAIRTVLSALGPLAPPQRASVLEYVFRRLGYAPDGRNAVAPASPGSTPARELDARPHSTAPAPVVTDIRTLRESKTPRSAVEMALIVGYYLSEVAPAASRQSTFGVDDINTYFKQAGYPLPSQPRQVLFNAKTAGYLDSPSTGSYRLNPVGHNLVVHGLPATTTSGAKPKASRKAAKRGKRKE